jgi:hypothetical protein
MNKLYKGKKDTKKVRISHTSSAGVKMSGRPLSIPGTYGQAKFICLYTDTVKKSLPPRVMFSDYIICIPESQIDFHA